MKKHLFFILVCLLISMFMVCTAAAEEEKEILRDGDWRYRVLDDGTAEIVSYAVYIQEGHISIPEQVNGIPVSSLGNKSFDYIHMDSVTIPDSVVSIGDNAFSNCDKLTEIKIPGNLRHVGVNPFCSCPNLVKIEVSESNPYLEMKDGALISKEEKRLICHLFNYITFNGAGIVMNSYTVPGGVEIIGESAFYREKAAVEIVLPDSVTTIDKYAFYGSDVRKVDLPGSLISIGEQAFAECESLMFITLPENLETIGSYAFFRCSSLTEMSIPNSVRSVGDNPFGDCKYLKEAKVSPDHDYLALVDHVLFSKPDRRLISFPCYTDVTEYTIPQGIRLISGQAFAFAESLRSVTIPDSVTEIGEEAFWYCTGITGISIPESVVRVGKRAFFACKSLVDITIPDTVTALESSALGRCNKLQRVKLPDGLKEIGEYMFEWDECLNSVIIPQNLSSIGKYAFNQCHSLKNLEIPDSVSFIDPAAFNCCENLTLTVGRDSYAKQYCEENGISYNYADSLDWLND